MRSLCPTLQTHHLKYWFKPEQNKKDNNGDSAGIVLIITSIHFETNMLEVIQTPLSRQQLQITCEVKIIACDVLQVL